MLASYFASIGQTCLYEYGARELSRFEVRLIEMRGQSKNGRFLRRLMGGAGAYPSEKALEPGSIPASFDFYAARSAFDL
jgi:hypothetical protein